MYQPKSTGGGKDGQSTPVGEWTNPIKCGGMPLLFLVFLLFFSTITYLPFLPYSHSLFLSQDHSIPLSNPQHP